MTTSTKGYLEMKLLRFSTAGSVDDGKSTLIGRLLYDSKAIFADQMEAIEQASKRMGEEYVNLALLTDGLRAEREQGITIDVAYRYFATPKRKFIIADTPGHIQYTRNMVTGASTSNAALILIDARQGIVEQTLRHAYIASLLQIPHIIICVNKMDLVEYKESVFASIRADFNKIESILKFKHITFIPISALKGDNVVDHSDPMSWYKGPTLLEWLETVDIDNDTTMNAPRFPVQHVSNENNSTYLAGRVASGAFFKGDLVKVLPSDQTLAIKFIDTFNGPIDAVHAPLSVSLGFDGQIQAKRGSIVVPVNSIPRKSNEVQIMLCWMNDKQLKLNTPYIVKHTTSELLAEVASIDYKVNINTLENNTADKVVKMNDIARVTIKTSAEFYFDSYNENRITGSLIIIDTNTNETVGAGMII
jgi:sulfate adenylyltransferase subunit 1